MLPVGEVFDAGAQNGADPYSRSPLCPRWPRVACCTRRFRPCRARRPTHDAKCARRRREYAHRRRGTHRQPSPPTRAGCCATRFANSCPADRRAWRPRHVRGAAIDRPPAHPSAQQRPWTSQLLACSLNVPTAYAGSRHDHVRFRHRRRVGRPNAGVSTRTWTRWH